MPKIHHLSILGHNSTKRSCDDYLVPSFEPIDQLEFALAAFARYGAVLEPRNVSD